jgi:hypothetical protein
VIVGVAKETYPGEYPLKVWTLMTLGLYEPPRQVWMPWVLY